jgi:2-methylcitrate dehydratase
MGDYAEVTAQALAISATHQNTLAQIQHGRIAMIKASADAWVAKGAVEAALLAEHGLTGPDEIFEGTAGWTAAVAGAVDYECLLRPLDGAFGILEARIKPFAAVGPAQAPVQAAVEIFERHRPAAEDIEEVVVALPRRIIDDPAVTGAEKRFPKNRETADHSYAYCVAVALLDGDCGEAQYSPEKLASPAVRRLLERTRLEADAEYSERRTGGGVRLTLRDGTVHEVRRPFPPGSAGNPLSDRQVEAKFERQMAAHFSTRETAAIKAAILGLENCASLGDLAAMLARP